MAKDVGATSIPYPAYVMFSMALWQTFVEALNGPVAAVGTAKPMLAKINFPREALVLAKLGALYQDIGRAIPLLMTPWLLLTPVIYPPPRTGWFSVLVSWNPVTPLLVTVRDLATVGKVSEPAGFWWASGLMVVVLLSGWLFYRLAMPFIVERMSS